MDSLLGKAVAAGQVPGVAAALTTADGPCYEGAFGVRALGESAPMALDTVMWIASMTKPIIGAAAMQLVEQGRIGLDDPAAKLIPELGTFQVLEGWDANGEPRLRPPKTEITLRRLLTHTAGFTYDTWNADMARFYKLRSLPRAGSGREIALRIPLSFDPGERWEYGINIDWAGRMIEAASGLRLGEYLKRNLTGPLGMNSTGFRITPDMRARKAKVHQRGADGSLATIEHEVPQDPEFEPGGGGLYSTAADYAKFIRMILNGGRGNGQQVLKPETVAQMSKNSMGDLRVRMLPSFSPALSRDAEFFPGVPKTWGLSFMINEARAPTGRSPGSLSWAGLPNCYFWIDPAKRIGGVCMMQVLPFVDEKCLNLFSSFESRAYRSLT
jgi:CubicO group peptidase (beta-lactamase class C family)